MSRFSAFSAKTTQTLKVFVVLARIIIPVAIAAEILSRMGVIAAVSPVFAPVMRLYGLPGEFALVWLTALLVGIWGAVPLIFTLVPISSLSIADITVFSSLMLFAHALPIEQKIIQKAGPSLTVTTVIRIAGALLYALLLHHVLAATGWLSGPVSPAWIPISPDQSWAGFALGLGKTLLFMLVILLVLAWVLELLRMIGVLDLMMRAIAPLLRLAGIRDEALQFTTIGLFLGIAYGAGLLIGEASSGRISPRQVVLSCIFMGFAHSVIEDTLVMVAIGADLGGVLAGRLVFALIATQLIARLIQTVPLALLSRRV
ncbi:MAG: nucleoside recognition protein [Hyphomicrobiales bacterium]|nr:MAG: nucleoside recognition protein [Hyphomicrobiales bacterium]